MKTTDGRSIRSGREISNYIIGRGLVLALVLNKSSPCSHSLSFLCSVILFVFSGCADEENQTNTVSTYGGSGLLSEADHATCRMCLSFSSARESEGLFPQPVHVAHG